MERWSDMTKDYTAATIRLEKSYQSMQLARKVIAAEVRAEFRAKERAEIERRQLAVKVAFAQEMAEEMAAGLPGNIIREKVLRTRDWGRWVDYRDLAGIEPERVTAQKARQAREQAENPFEWSSTRDVLIVRLNSRGEPLATPLEYDMTTNRFTGGVWWPDLVGGDDTPETEARRGDANINNMVSAEIQRAIDAGEIEA